MKSVQPERMFLCRFVLDGAWPAEREVVRAVAVGARCPLERRVDVRAGARAA
ncbi:hypothetical protein [Sorangium sp. So ce1389]|uniref:hypothetical protein n=1 Tax=Sorangium sp. So ce1389 TaxID=3133336 RepID=UPI003F622A50